MRFEADEARTRFLAHVHDVTVTALTKVAELRDTETGEHLVRMRSYSQIIAEELGRDGPYTEQIDEQFLEDLYRASPLHDIGKVGINDAILLKPARLTPEEFETMKQHTTIGANILDHVASGAPDASFLGMAAIVARLPSRAVRRQRLSRRAPRQGDPAAARIVALADAFDAITSLRPYKAAQSAAAARDIIVEGFRHALRSRRRGCLPAPLRDAGDRSSPGPRTGRGRRRRHLLSARAVGRRQPVVLILESSMEPNPATAKSAPPESDSAGPVYSCLAGDPMLGELVDFFVEEMPERINALAVVARNRDWSQLTRTAHQLKGSAGSYGFTKITPYAARLEAAAHDPEHENAILLALNDLLSLCRRVRSGSGA